MLPFKRDGGPDTLRELKVLLEAYAAGRPVAVEIFDEAVKETDVMHAKQRLGVELAGRARMFVSFWGEQAQARAVKLAAGLHGANALVVGGNVLIDPVLDRGRAAIQGHRSGGNVHLLDGLVVTVTGLYWFTQPHAKGKKVPPSVVDRAGLETALAVRLPPRSYTITGGPAWHHGSLTVTVETDEPGRVLSILDAEAKRQGCDLHVGVADAEPLAWALRRLLA